MVEIFAVDLVVRRLHHVAAAVLLLVPALRARWIVGFARAIPLRPILLDETLLSRRVGEQAAIDIPQSNIAREAVTRADTG
ncbi:MAG TPA: hypothetical protein VGN65_10390 [Casimicrobiaceae bacterium]